MNIGMSALQGYESGFDHSQEDGETQQKVELSDNARAYLEQNRDVVGEKVASIGIFSQTDEHGLGIYTTDELDYSQLEFRTDYRSEIVFTDGQIDRKEDTYEAQQRGTPRSNNFSTKVTGATLVVKKTTQTGQDDKYSITTTQDTEETVKSILR